MVKMWKDILLFFKFFNYFFSLLLLGFILLIEGDFVSLRHHKVDEKSEKMKK